MTTLDKREHKREYTNRRNQHLKHKYVDLMGGCCQCCNYSKYLAALEFHHVDPATKTCNPGRVIYSGNHEKAIEELDKCVLLCKNCHAAYEAGHMTLEFVKVYGLGWMVTKSELNINNIFIDEI